MKNITKLFTSDIKVLNVLFMSLFFLAFSNTKAATVVDIIVGSEVHTTLATAVTEANLVGALQGEGPFTVFAPTDAAFAALPEGTVASLLEDPSGALTDILLYHVVQTRALSGDLSNGQIIRTMLAGKDITVTLEEGRVFINEAEVVIANLEADNGVVHVIDAVLIPAADPLPATVVDIIVGSEVHTTLATAVTEANLVGALQGEGPFTVFAPTDAAFAALPEGTLTSLLEDPSGALTDILLYHVVQARALSGDLSNGQIISTMLEGKDITVTLEEGRVFINEAEVVIANLEADNGVVHVIDAVLIPVVETSIIERSNIEIFNVNVYPNPATDRINIDVYLEKPQQVTIELFTVTGERIVFEHYGFVSAGATSFSHSLQGIKTGVYFMTLTAGDNLKVSRLQIFN